MKYRGCAYYPEYWGPQRLAIDLKLMREAEMNLVRIAEFAWARLEPRENEFDFSWLLTAIDQCNQHGIDVLMCTPTAAPPAWLTANYPQTLAARPDGTRLSHGARRHYCYTDPVYLRHCDRIVTAMAAATRDCRNVIGWQIDNELGPENSWCFCDHCHASFRQWLQRRYETLDHLNQAWGTGFWTTDHSDWAQLKLVDPVCRMGPARVLDQRRFWSDALVTFAQRQAVILRAAQPHTLITTNSPGSCPINDTLDNNALFAGMDVAANDLYFDIGPINQCLGAMDFFRCLKPGKPFWITETGAAALDWGKPPTAAQFAAWAWSGLARGAEAWTIFRWRTCPSGQEQDLQGLLELSGRPGRRYHAAKKVFAALADFSTQFGQLPPVPADVAIVFDHHTAWAYGATYVNGAVNLMGQLNRVHACLLSEHVMTDIISTGHDLHRYRLVVLASLAIVPPAFAAALEKFVAAGGTVLALGQLGVRDENNNYFTAAGPAGVQSLFGLTVDGGMYLRRYVGPDEGLFAGNRTDVTVPMTGTIGETAHTSVAHDWIAEIFPQGCRTLLQFSGDEYDGNPAFTQHAYDKGNAFYLGTTRVEEFTLQEITRYVLGVAKIAGLAHAPATVDVVRRGDMIFAINHDAKAATVSFPEGPKQHVIVGKAGVGSTIQLAPFGIYIASMRPTK